MISGQLKINGNWRRILQRPIIGQPKVDKRVGKGTRSNRSLILT